jgi:hypothetical protein
MRAARHSDFIILEVITLLLVIYLYMAKFTHYEAPQYAFRLSVC